MNKKVWGEGKEKVFRRKNWLIHHVKVIVKNIENRHSGIVVNDEVKVTSTTSETVTKIEVVSSFTKSI